MLPSKKKILGDYKETELIRLIQQLGAKYKQPIPNEDAFPLTHRPTRQLVLNIDTYVESEDFLPGLSWSGQARRFFHAAFSDIAAKGAQPLTLFTSIAAPPTMKIKDFYHLLKGFFREAHKYKIKYQGGDLAKANEVIISVVALGTVKKDHYIQRFSFDKGDQLWTTGEFGWTALGFQHLLNNMYLPPPIKKYALRKTFNPHAQFKAVKHLKKLNINIKAAIDSSDGLARSLWILANETKSELVITRLPIAPIIKHYFSDEIAFSATFFGGEEYELVFVLNKDDSHTLQKILDEHKKDIRATSFQHIGTVANKGDTAAVFFLKNSKKIHIPNKGWDTWQRP